MSSQPRQGYRSLEHMSDAFIEAWGENFENALAQAALAFSNTITDTTTIHPIMSEQIGVGGHDELELLYNWLEELLLKFEVGQMVFCQFRLDPVKRHGGSYELASKASGEKFDSTRHPRRVEVKGVTYHLMAVERFPSRTLVRFILDL